MIAQLIERYQLPIDDAVAAAIEAEIAAGTPPPEAPGVAYERSRTRDRAGKKP